MRKFHAGILETAIGPGLGSFADLIELIQKSRDAAFTDGDQARMSDWMNYALNNNPVWPANLYWTRPVLDYLFLHSLREVASPGAHRRAEERRRRQYGQHTVYSKPLDPFGGFR